MPQRSAEPPPAPAEPEDLPPRALCDPRGLAEWMRLVHHELGNQLAAVRMAAELLRAGDVGEVASMIERATASAAALLVQAEPLLATPRVRPEPLEAETLLHNAAEAVRAQGVSPATIRSEHAARLMAPRELAQQALVSLLVAAPGAAELEARAAGPRTLVAVSDAGTPIPAGWASQRAPQGRVLMLQLVAEVLASFDISVASAPASAGNRIILSFPSALEPEAPLAVARRKRVEPAGGDPA